MTIFERNAPIIAEMPFDLLVAERLLIAFKLRRIKERLAKKQQPRPVKVKRSRGYCGEQDGKEFWRD